MFNLPLLDAEVVNADFFIEDFAANKHGGATNKGSVVA
jgi:hypothetical protein